MIHWHFTPPGTQESKRQSKREKLKVVAGRSVGLVDSESELDDEANEADEAGENELAPEFERSDSSDEDNSLVVEENSNSEECYIEKFGRHFQHVKYVQDGDIKIDDWLLVAFSPETKKSCSSKMMYYICQVTDRNDSEFEGNFLREKNTRDDSGFIYHYPDIEDRTKFEYVDVVGKLDEPEKFRRGNFKFKINLTTYK